MANEIENDDGGSVGLAKLIAGLGLFFVSTICGIIPFKLAKIFKWTEPLDQHNENSDKKTSLTVNILLCFGGGVLLATTFLHLLPEISHTIDGLIEDGMIPDTGLNLAEVLMMTGFFLIYLIEELVHFYLHQHQHKKKKALDKKSKEPEEDFGSTGDIGGAFRRGINARSSAVINQFSEARFDPQQNNSIDDLIPTDKSLDSVAISQKNNANNHGHGHSHIIPLPHSEEEDMLVSSLRGLLIVLALSIHELFEGFAVGLELDSKGVYFMFAAVSAHKFVIAFCIGVELMVQRTQLWLAFVYVLIYSAVSAIGIAIGALLTSGSYADDLQVPNVILQGLATGTLLYVIFFEVLSKDRSGLFPYLSVLGGFLLMFGLQYIAGVSESQSSTGEGKSHHSHHRHHHH